MLRPWATPSTRDWKDTPGMSETGVNPDGSERTRLDQLPRQAGLAASWRSPSASDGEGGVMEIRPGTAGKYKLRDEAPLASWPTTTVNDATGSQYAYSGGNHDKPVLKLPGAAQLTASGPTPNGSPAGTGSGGQLNPSMSRFLMGLPAEWDLCAIEAMKNFKRGKK